MSYRFSNPLVIGALAFVGAVLAYMPIAAVAQVVPAPPKIISPLMAVEDDNKVNIKTGKMAQDLPMLSIPAAPRLSLTRATDFQPYLIASIPVPYASRIETAVVSIHLGSGQSESFLCNDYDCKADAGSGSELVYSNDISGKHFQARLISASNGAAYTFDLQSLYVYQPPNGAWRTDGNAQATVYASKIEYPDGETITLTYDSQDIGANRTIYRPNMAASNAGYGLKFQYLGNGTYSNDWNKLATASLFRGAAGDDVIRSLTYTYEDPGLVSIFEAEPGKQGRTYRIETCGCALVGGVEVSSGSVTLPDMTVASRVITKNQDFNVVSSVMQEGRRWSYEYLDIKPDPKTIDTYAYSGVRVTDPAGGVKTYLTDNLYRSGFLIGKQVRSIQDEIGRVYQYTYVNQRVATVIDPGGGMTSFAYDERGNVTERRQKTNAAGQAPDIVQSAFFDLSSCVSSINIASCFKPVWYRDANGHQTDYTYNNRGQLETQTDPADQDGVRRRTVVEYAMSAAGISRPVRVRTCAFHLTNAALTTCGTTAELVDETDYFGDTALPLVTRHIEGGSTFVTTRGYDRAGRLLLVDPPGTGNGDATYRRYDDLGRLQWEIGAAGSNGSRTAKRYTYRDSDDQLSLVETGTMLYASSETLNVVEQANTFFDDRRKPIRVIRSGNGTTTVADASFDSLGRLLCTTQRMNQNGYGNLPADACTLADPGTDGADRVTRNVYDAAGQLLQVQKAVGTPVEQAYVTYRYSMTGKRTDVVDANGSRSQMIYDGFDRLIRWSFPDKAPVTGFAAATPTSAFDTAGAVSGDDYERYDYDPAGNRTLVRRRDGRVLTFGFDALDRMTSKLVPDGCAPIQTGACPDASATRDVYYGYDLLGRQSYARFDSTIGEGVTNVFDGQGRLKASTMALGGIRRTLTYDHDEAGNRIKIVHPDGAFFAMRYDDAGRMTNASWWTAAGGIVPFLAISYDGSGRRIDVNRGSSHTGYSYDGLSRLTAQSQRFADGADDLHATFGYNAAAQMTQWTYNKGAFAFTGHVNVDRGYTMNGLNQYVTAGPAAFRYDANGNLIGDGTRDFGYDAENRLVSTSGGISLSYDPLGRLWQMSGGGAGTRQFLYDGDALVAEYDGAGVMVRRYMHGPGVDEPILMDEGSALDCSGTRFLHNDHQGSVIALADCWGHRTAIDTYDEYGIPGVGNVGRFQYTGQAWLPELGIYYYKARVYSPTLGRFLQTDPIGYDDQINLYAYVGNDPVNGRDPSGTETVGQYFEGVWNDIKDFGSAIAHGDFEYALGGLPPTLGGGVVSEGLAGARAVAAVRTEVSASTRVAQVHSVLDPIAQGRRTTAVLDTTKGRIVAGGGRDLTPAQRAALRPGETAARAPGAHAEATALRQAAASGATPRSLAASRPICSSCAAEIRNDGGRLTSPTTATFKNSKPWWKFW